MTEMMTDGVEGNMSFRHAMAFEIRRREMMNDRLQVCGW